MSWIKHYSGTPIIKFLPRVRVKEHDRNDRVFPSKHDELKYSDNISFPSFTSSYVNYPTRMPSGPEGDTLLHMQGRRSTIPYLLYLTSSLNCNASINLQAFEPWIEEIYTGSIEPFKEIGLHELENHTDNFYMTGSRLQDVGEGLTNPLKDKHQLKFELYVSGDTPLNPESGSAYYYDFNNKTFSEVAPELRTAPSSSQLSTNDFRLFTPFGTPAISGTTILDVFGYIIESSSPYQFDNATISVIQELLSTKESGSFCVNSSYDAQESQLYSMKNLIKYPFLVESALINIPIKAGLGWLNDKTIFHVTDSFDTDGAGFNFFLSSGGPCVNFAILNQFSDSRKDIILSASLVPSGDLITDSITSTQYEEFSDTIKTVRCPTGFRYFGGEPAGIINSSTEYTGTVTLKSKPSISNGFYSTFHDLAASPDFQATRDTSSPILINNPGRSQDVRGSSRSIFGKEFTSRKLSTVITSPNNYYFGERTQDVDLSCWNVIESNNSPYVIFPDDKLSFLITKHRSVQSIDVTTLSASHDVQIGEGEVTVTLYGSYLQNDVEYPYTVDSKKSHEALNTPLALKVIGDDPVLDQFNEYAYTDQLTESYLDQYVTGSMSSERGIVLHQFNPGEKLSLEQNFSSARAQSPSELLNQFVYVKALDDNEIFNDSLVPSMADINKRDKVHVMSFAGVWAMYILDYDQLYNPSEYNSTNPKWTKSFPFQPKYSNLSRFEYDKVKHQIFDDSANRENLVEATNSCLIKLYGITGLRYLQDKNVNTNDAVSLNKEDYTKYMFGTGDLKTYRSGSNGYFGTLTFPESRLYTSTNGPSIYASPIVRGWKYGLLSGLTTHTSLILNPKSHGQFRDILEQRLDSKFYYESSNNANNDTVKSYLKKSPVEARFVDVDEKTTLPEKTNSSNLSLHATSSLPFFDGEFRNRSEEPDQNYINTSMLSIKNDGTGNIEVI